ncbi:homogentisate 1,2-dioxygenase [Paenibacillus rhizovicinus]|uniref:Homogentisate 1,2-dioxygenase n=1 Tax=Paenibacillus rhizovicinus TaxID=2704463 RepID=A0A6C0P8W4_9BACL|nr:homogentisate 1,2-dioxygenase [Paenibacillus rhizovicinus]QHW34825.1 homogentisate 1,2-dioxygenase [Paenibacillus rhizovicinus]
MPFYHRMGTIPPKRHTQFRRPDGGLFREQVMGTKGFSGIQSILYHRHAPAEITKARLLSACKPAYEPQGALRHRHIRTNSLQRQGDAVAGRQYVLGNEDLIIGVANVSEAMDYYYRNGDGDELLFVHEGTGKVETMYGALRYRPGDYIVLPIGTIYRIIPDTDTESGAEAGVESGVEAGAEGTVTSVKNVRNKFLVVETNSWITAPKRYRNEHGQLLENSPYCERDIRVPEVLETFAEPGEVEVRIKKDGYLHSHVLSHHPLDVVGWDGFLYPWILNIQDFEPITGRIHMPPPIHQTFEGNQFVICSFCPRMYDYHPLAIPAPYYHSNVDSDEVLYYVKGNFGSRKGIEEGSITIHPAGIPHGPHPGKAEESIGKKETSELAVMIDTFRPLHVVEGIQGAEDPNYAYSWVTQIRSPDASSARDQ